LLLHKVLPLALELYLCGLQVPLPSPQASDLLPMVVHVAAGTLVQRHELGRLLGESLAIDVVAHAWWGIAVDVIGVILWAISP
jgi:hypothetical protein